MGKQVRAGSDAQDGLVDPAASGEEPDILSGHEVTSGEAEGLNSKIMATKQKACGYRIRDHFQTAIYFFCGGLDL